MTSDNPVADLFSSDPEVANTGADAILPEIAALIASPGWFIYKELILRTRQAHAMRVATGALHPTLDLVVMETARLNGYLAGLQDAVDSAENLVKVKREVVRKKQEEEETPRERSIRLHGRGGM